MEFPGRPQGTAGMDPVKQPMGGMTGGMGQPTPMVMGGGMAMRPQYGAMPPMMPIGRGLHPLTEDFMATYHKSKEAGSFLSCDEFFPSIIDFLQCLQVLGANIDLLRTLADHGNEVNQSRLNQISLEEVDKFFNKVLPSEQIEMFKGWNIKGIRAAVKTTLGIEDDFLETEATLPTLQGGVAQGGGQGVQPMISIPPVQPVHPPEMYNYNQPPAHNYPMAPTGYAPGYGAPMGNPMSPAMNPPGEAPGNRAIAYPPTRYPPNPMNYPERVEERVNTDRFILIETKYEGKKRSEIVHLCRRNMSIEIGKGRSSIIRCRDRDIDKEQFKIEYSLDGLLYITCISKKCYTLLQLPPNKRIKLTQGDYVLLGETEAFRVLNCTNTRGKYMTMSIRDRELNVDVREEMKREWRWEMEEDDIYIRILFVLGERSGEVITLPGEAMKELLLGSQGNETPNNNTFLGFTSLRERHSVIGYEDGFGFYILHLGIGVFTYLALNSYVNHTLGLNSLPMSLTSHTTTFKAANTLFNILLIPSFQYILRPIQLTMGLLNIEEYQYILYSNQVLIYYIQIKNLQYQKYMEDHTVCIVHHNELAFICLDCNNLLICNICLKEQHENHRVQELSQLISTYITKMTDLSNKYSMNSTKLNPLFSQLTNLNSEIETLINKEKAFVKDIVVKIKETFEIVLSGELQKIKERINVFIEETTQTLEFTRIKPSIQKQMKSKQYLEAYREIMEGTPDIINEIYGFNSEKKEKTVSGGIKELERLVKNSHLEVENIESEISEKNGVIENKVNLWLEDVSMMASPEIRAKYISLEESKGSKGEEDLSKQICYASGLLDRTILIWDSNFRAVMKLTEHKDGVTCLKGLPGLRLVSGSSDHTVRIWNLPKIYKTQTQNSLKTQNSPRKTENSPKPRKSVIGRKSPISRENVMTECIFEDHRDSVRCIDTRGKILASGGADTDIYIYNLEEREKIGVLTEHNDEVLSLCFYSGGEEFLVSGSADQNIRIWEIDGYTCIRTLNLHKKEIVSIIQLMDGRMASCCHNKVLIWDLPSMVYFKSTNTLKIPRTDKDYFWQLAEIPKYNNTMKTEKIEHAEKIDGDGESGGESSAPNSSMLLIGGLLGSIKGFDLTTQECKCSMELHEEQIRSIIPVEDSKVLTCSFDNSIKLLDVQLSQVLLTIGTTQEVLSTTKLII